MGWARPIFFREKGWAKREFQDGWGWVDTMKNMWNNIWKRMLEGLPANLLNVLMVLLFCLITFTQVFQNVQKTLSFLMVNTFQST